MPGSVVMGRSAESSGRGELVVGRRGPREGSWVTRGECETLDCPEVLPLPTNRTDGEPGFIKDRE